MLGDSVQNIIGDVFSCGLGYVLGTVFLAFELWWLSIVWALVSEVSISISLILSITRSPLDHSYPPEGCLHPLHERQPPDDRHHHPGPL